MEEEMVRLVVKSTRGISIEAEPTEYGDLETIDNLKKNLQKRLEYGHSELNDGEFKGVKFVIYKIKKSDVDEATKLIKSYLLSFFILREEEEKEELEHIKQQIKHYTNRIDILKKEGIEEWKK